MTKEEAMKIRGCKKAPADTEIVLVPLTPALDWARNVDPEKSTCLAAVATGEGGAALYIWTGRVWAPEVIDSNSQALLDAARAEVMS